jgi:uncharacterized membrane protein
MIDIIFALKFVHVIAVAAMFGTWLCLALFIVFAHRSANNSVVALTSRFAVRVELMVVAPAIVVLPVSGFPLAQAVGLSPSDEFWIVLSLAIYLVVIAAWLAIVAIEFRMRNVTRDAALIGAPIPKAYRRLFRVWSLLAVPILAGMVAVIAVMIWQPRWS